MPRILGVDIPNNKPTWISLTYLHGIGRHQSRKILEACGIDGSRGSFWGGGVWVCGLCGTIV